MIMNKNKMPLSALETPAVIVYLDVLEANIARMSRLAREAGVRLRPHTKIHECPEIARMQMDAGACGIEVGAVERAVCMADAGIEDILIAHPFFGEQKLAVLRRLLEKPRLKLTVVVDMEEQAEGVSRTGRSLGRPIPTLLKVDTGGNRFGVPPGEPALRLARRLCDLKGIAFQGIYVHEMGGTPTPEGMAKLARETLALSAETARLLLREGIPCSHVSVGASPTLAAACAILKEKEFPEITEIHPGHCAISDMWHVRGGVCSLEACAVAVLCTVMSTAKPGHVMVDAGYKTFGADSLIQYRDQPGFFWQGKPRFGAAQNREDLWPGKLYAETACVQYLQADIPSEARLKPGDRLEIVPNNATLVISRQERIYGVRNGLVERVFAVGGRGSIAAAPALPS
jgi:D-serine deaminase-like pyridoxal phosphate-dependent protein